VSGLADPWRRLSPAGKVILPIIALFVLGTIAFTVVWVVGIGPAIANFALDTAGANIGIVRFLAAATGVLLFTVPAAFVIIFMEMKIIAFVNLRLGPNRVGPWGTLSSTIHGLKVLAKEDFTPSGVDAPVFTLAPAVVYLAAVLTLLVIPFAPGMVGAEMELGLLYFFAVASLGVIGLMMAGWSSFNKYSLLGGLRAAAAIVSCVSTHAAKIAYSGVGDRLVQRSATPNATAATTSGSSGHHPNQGPEATSPRPSTTSAARRTGASR